MILLYNQLFSKGMKNKWDQRVYIDLFCGAGKSRIETSGRIVLGSPMLALGVEDKYDTYIFCDEDERSIHALQCRVASHHPSVKPKFVVGDCNQKVDEICAHIPKPSVNNTVLTFCLVDPYALRFKFETIRRLGKFLMDFLILLPFGMDVNRNRKKYFQENHTRIEDFLGLSDWRSRWAVTQTKDPSFQRFLAREFAAQMVCQGYRSESLHSMIEIRSSEKNLPLYHLAFFSKHELGYKFWREGRRSVEEPELPFRQDG